ncbi:Crp/Fnr family transcriptional regulator [Fundidesulfovibrio soli]|uniref:Crp/Fnr family transcriptional regulator n=1 Tax=Fundidesulfovibrio soli TaxID=2922716 RepID=UPI001FAE8BAD|nr:Crp/Fnr family transcriptional regulator [Fundidesulfovibrio soli]
MGSRLRSSGRNLLEIIYKEENKVILDALHERSYRKRHLLFMPYHKEDLVCIVKTGKLRMYMGLEGKELSLSMLGPGDIFSTHSRAYVEALEDTTILACPVFKFFKAAMERQEFMLPLLMSLGDILTGALSIIERLYFHDIDKRVAAFFYEEALLRGENSTDGMRLHVGLTVDNIAKIVGSSRQTVSSLISAMEKNGIMKKLSRGEYLITDMEELRLTALPCAE